MSAYKLKSGGMAKKATSAFQEIEDAVVGGYRKVEDKFTEAFLEKDGSLKTGGMAKKSTAAYQKIEDAVVGGYQKVEDTVVGSCKKVEGAFVDTFLEKTEDGEISAQADATAEDAE